MTKRDRMKWNKAGSDARRQVFTRTCECRNPAIQSAVQSGLFCTRCFHPVVPAKSAVRVKPRSRRSA